MAGVIIIESIFHYDGIGGLYAGSIASNDRPVVIAFTIYLLIVFLVLSALVDVFNAHLDPRVRLPDRAT